MDIQSFLKQNVKSAEIKEEVKLERFSEPFLVQGITEKENDRLKKSSTKRVRAKNGSLVSDFDADRYSDLLLERCVVSPDLTNAELQESYGTPGDAIGTLKAMLLSGEYANLTQEVIKLNGFDEDVAELKEEVKN